MATRRCSYTAAFKLKLVEYAERHGNRCAGRDVRSLYVIVCALNRVTIQIRVTGLKYGCDLYSGKYGTYIFCCSHSDPHLLPLQ